MVTQTEIKKSPKKQRIFELAKELKIQTLSLIEYLVSKGFAIERRQMQPVDDEMYLAILQKFDKAGYSKYQLDHSTAPEAVQKRDSERLRKEEQEKILAVKTPAAAELNPLLKSSKKIELPQFRDFVIETMSGIEDSAADSKKIGIEKLIRSDGEEEDVRPEGEKFDDAIFSDKKTVARGGKSSLKDKFAEIAKDPTVAPVELEPPRESIKDMEMPSAGIRKIDLPKFESLHIIEEAKKKLDTKSKPTPTDPDRSKSRAAETKIKDIKSSEEVVYPSVKKKSRRLLRRKRMPVNLEDAAEITKPDLGTEFRKELQRLDRQKPIGSKDASIATPSRRGKYKGEVVDLGAAPAKPGRRRRRQNISDVDVNAAIKETLAKIGGRGRSHKKASTLKDAESESKPPEVLKVTEYLTTQEIASLMDIPYQDLIQKCIEMGMLISINQRLDKETIELLAAEFDIEVEFILDVDEDEVELEDDAENQSKRSPVVTIMGHVDHGKTTLLDFLRDSSVAESEVGGITQHIGAYAVNYKGENITFLDTPGHEAFTAMRARGAQITDLVVLVVAADDKVMPQTIEAIDHARAAGTPIVVAVNKIDKPAADPEKIYKQLADNNLLVEKWGGKYQSAEISAKFGQGVDDLLSEILVAADILELKANPDKRSWGVVIESRLDRGLGAVATIMIQNGTLKIGDPIVVGNSYGRVRALYNEQSENVLSAGPSTPVQVVGFSGVPQAGDRVMGYESEKEAKEVSQKRQRQLREVSARKIKSLTLEQASMKMRDAELQNLPLLIKGDVHGSIEVLSDALMKLSTNEVKVDIILKGVGAITESDVLLAAASEAIIIGFHVHPNIQARELARREKVEIRLYRIIHEIVDDIFSSLEGLLAPTVEERTIGSLEIRQTFKVSRIGNIAGSYVLSGKINRKDKVRLIRDDVEIWSGVLSSLRRFKEDVREVSSGFECGLVFDGYRDPRVGDRIEAYEKYEVQRKLDAPA